MIVVQIVVKERERETVSTGTYKDMDKGTYKYKGKDQGMEGTYKDRGTDRCQVIIKGKDKDTVKIRITVSSRIILNGRL